MPLTSIKLWEVIANNTIISPNIWHFTFIPSIVYAGLQQLQSYFLCFTVSLFNAMLLSVVRRLHHSLLPNAFWNLEDLIKRCQFVFTSSSFSLLNYLNFVYTYRLTIVVHFEVILIVLIASLIVFAMLTSWHRILWRLNCLLNFLPSHSSSFAPLFNYSPLTIHTIWT